MLGMYIKAVFFNLGVAGCQKCESCVLGMNNKCEHNEGGATDIGQHPERNGGFATYVPVPECRFLIKVGNTYCSNAKK